MGFREGNRGLKEIQSGVALSTFPTNRPRVHGGSGKDGERNSHEGRMCATKGGSPKRTSTSRHTRARSRVDVDGTRPAGAEESA